MQEIAHPIKYSVALFLTQISASANIASIRDPAKKESTMDETNFEELENEVNRIIGIIKEYLGV